MESNELWKLVVEAAEDKKAQGVTVMDIEKVSIVADCIVLASGTSSTHVHAIANSIIDAAEKAGFVPKVEGLNEAKWVLIDMGIVIAHVMTQEIRTFYSLEELWAKAERVYGQAGDNQAAH